MKNIFNFKKIKTSFLILLVVPILAIIYFSYNYLERPIELSGKMESIKELSELAVKSSALVHELQKERGRSSGFFNSRGKKFAKELPEQRKLSDTKLQDFMNFLDKFDTESHGEEFSSNIRNIKNRLSKLESNRGTIDRFESTAPQVLGYYTQTISAMLDNVNLIAVLSSVDSDLFNTLLTYKNLLEFKERNGILRAVFAGIFSADSFTEFFYKKAIELKAEAGLFYQNFQRYATQAQKDAFVQTVQGKDVSEVARMENYAIDNHNAETLGIDASYWFSTITSKINLIKNVEDKIADNILQTSSRLHGKAQNTVIINIAAVVLIFSIILVLSVVIIKGISNPINQAKEAAENIARGNLDVNLETYKKDEIGQLIFAMKAMSDNIASLSNESDSLILSIQNGNLDMRGDSEKYEGRWKDMVVGINNLIDAFVAPINMTAEYIDRISKGDIPPKITDEYKGDFNEIKSNLNHCIDALNGLEETANILDKVAAGDSEARVDVELVGIYQNIVENTNKVGGAINFIVNDLKQLTEAAVAGMLDTRADAMKHEGDYRAIVDGFNNTLDNIIEPLNIAAGVLSELASGDLTSRMSGEYSGKFDTYKNNINTLGDSLTDVISQVIISAESVATSSNQITALSGTLASSSEEQSVQSEEVASAVEEMARTISENAQNATATSEVADKNRSVANQGGEVVKQTVNKMRDIAEFVSNSAVSIEKLGERSTEIGEIVSVIDEIADQTNLLALNAAIEAARAGEQGRGFAVVADEVRKLAERTTDATKQIATMIKGVQKETQDAVAIMKKGNDEVNEGIALADKAGEALEEVVTSSNEVKDMINSIAAASEEQSSTSELMAKNVEAISQVANESARQITEISTASEKMGELTHRLLSLVDSFKISGHEELNKGDDPDEMARLQYRNQDDYSLVAAERNEY